MKTGFGIKDIENILHHLNYRWNLEALALWKGDKIPFEAYRIYEGYEDFISTRTLAEIDRVGDSFIRTRLRHALIDHYLQRALMPHETEMRSWMRGAAAHVNGQKIYFRNIISWCQKTSTYQERQILQKETGPLCKFLKPFALNYWKILLEILTKELGFESYMVYCSQKKSIDYPHYHRMIKELLQETDDIYFPALERWTRRCFGLPLRQLTRFDAINLLGFVEFDPLFPDRDMQELTRFFRTWQIDLGSTPGLNLDLGREEGKSAQAMCFILQVPEEVYVVMKPEGGWVDLETLWHELGHGLSAVFTSPDLSIVEKDMATSFSLSEAFAFLVQNVTMSMPFLVRHLGLKVKEAEKIFYYKVLKDLATFRRYAAKFLAEYEMFSSGELEDGVRYSKLMGRYTGFYYQPESHLFDLVPEFYSLDYVLGWLAEAVMEGFLGNHLGPEWMYSIDAAQVLKSWWSNGNRYEISQFIHENDLGPFTPALLLKRWRKVLNPS